MNFGSKVHWLWLLVPIGIFTVLRLPAVIHQSGGQDEQFFAVPGYTVWNEGIPRIPYFPARERSTFFENADRCLMALPPGLFYVQAPFFGLFSAGYPTARIPLFLAALVAIALMYALARVFGSSSMNALAAAGLLSLSRPLMFTGTIARPDLLCVVCGVGAILLSLRASEKTHSGIWVAIGTLCGLAGLFHPFALVFCIQAAAIAGLTPGSLRKRVIRIGLIALTSTTVLSLWLGLILRFPYEFRSQFFSNVLDRAGPGLPWRLVWPFPSFAHHARLLWEFAGPWQTLFLVIGLLGGSIYLFQTTLPHRPWKFLGLAWSSIYLTATVAGLHPTKGYWIYPTMMIMALMTSALSRLECPKFYKRAFLVMAILIMLPGAGLKTSWLYLRHWGSPKYHASNFIRGVLEEYPQKGLYLSDLSYVFDIYLTGRTTLLCKDPSDYANEVNLEYDYVFLAWEGADAGWAKEYKTTLLVEKGFRDPPQACYVDVLVKVKRQ